MNRIYGMITIGALAVLVSGCAPDANEVCEHLEKVYKNYASEPPGYMRSRDACMDYFERRKKQRGVNSYRREVECIQQSTKMFDINVCSEKEDQRMK